MPLYIMFEFANNRAKSELNNPNNKDVFVTVPDGTVYINSLAKDIKKHCEDNKLDIIYLKIDGVLQKEIKESKKKKLNEQ